MTSSVPKPPGEQQSPEGSQSTADARAVGEGDNTAEAHEEEDEEDWETEYLDESQSQDSSNTPSTSASSAIAPDVFALTAARGTQKQSQGSEEPDGGYGVWLSDGLLPGAYRLSPLGSLLAKLPLELRLGRMVLKAVCLRYTLHLTPILSLSQ